MRMCDKIKFMRQAKELSQEKMAEKLGLSLNGYANIERGDTDVASLRIKQIAEALDADFMELVSFGERNVVFLTGGEHHTYNVGVIQNSKFKSRTRKSPSHYRRATNRNFVFERNY